MTRPAVAEGARKALHLCTAALPVALATGNLSPERARIGALLVLTVAALAELGRARVPVVRAAIERLVGPLFREGERHAVSGATWLVVAITFALFALPFRAAVAATWAVSVGDASAALVGRVLSRGAHVSGEKTLAGSITCAVTTAVGVWWFTSAAASHAAAIGLAAAIAERLRVAVDDNVRVTAAAGLAAWALGVE